MIDMDHLKEWEGKSASASDVIRREPIDALAATLNWSKERQDALKELPLCGQWLYFHEFAPMRDLGRDGHPALGGFLPPVPLPRRMWAASEMTVNQPLQFHEKVTRISTVRTVEHKSGKSGDLIFVTVDHAYRGSEGGEIDEIHAIVYRDRPTPGAGHGKPQTAASEYDKKITIEPSTTLLFRYSALTFNGHRIHYDLDFCREVEGYDGLIVHGPLTATLLANLACQLKPQTRITRFSFKALSPLFHHQTFSITGRKHQNAVALQAINENGALAMTANAEMIPK